ncbi:MAG TPA: hypothetical protein PKA20_11200, partial [Burkholderiaceae bacterium]|nr:hypothetical protein [Burkholderiaceae bacterium]
TKEHLSASDAMIVAVRRQLINAAIRLRDEGKVPDNVDDPALDRVRAVTLNLPTGADWRKLSEEARVTTDNEPSRSDLYIIQ